MNKVVEIIFFLTVLVSSCDRYGEIPYPIAGMWAVVEDNDFTNKYIKFERGDIDVYESDHVTYYVADKSIWGCPEAGFKQLSSNRYSLVDGTLHYGRNRQEMRVEGETMILGDMKCRRVENICPEYYSTIKVSDPNILFAYKGSDQVWSYSVTRPVDGFALKAKGPDWVSGLRVTADKISFTVPETTTTRTGIITISYPSAEDLKISVTQRAAEINLGKTSVTLGYAASSSSFTYSIPDPQDGYTLKVEASHDWITDVKDNGSGISFSVKENNSGSSRTGKITVTYAGVSKVFTVTQSYTASGISLSPVNGSHDYTSGTYNFKYTITNPREGQDASFTASAQWITGITDSNGTVSYKVSENNSGSSRTGKITVTYAGVSKEFTVSQDLGPKNLSEGGTANCYVISTKGYYSFKSVKGNSSTSVGTVSSVEVLWETFGTSTTPSVGDLIKSVSYVNGTITFQTADAFKEGNAVIAAKDVSGTILWSWHIWLTDEPQGQVYYNNAGTMMDRNLGATSATPGDVGALGLLYQWGRKDPFLGSSSISDDVKAKSTITWPSAVSSDSSNGTIEYATSHPTTFITSNLDNYDWYYTGDSSTDNTRWTTSESTKSIYDPCPAGWRVPDGDSNGVWSKAKGSSSYFSHSYDNTNEGMNFSGTVGGASTIWYPASGYRSASGALNNVGYYGYYWSTSPGSSYSYSAYSLNIGYDGDVLPSYNSNRSCGCSVRCIKES